jgi:hypothetical protein
MRFFVCVAGGLLSCMQLQVLHACRLLARLLHCVRLLYHRFGRCGRRPEVRLGALCGC